MPLFITLNWLNGSDAPSMGRVATNYEEYAMSRRTVNRIRFLAGVGIATSGAVALAGHLVGLVAI